MACKLASEKLRKCIETSCIGDEIGLKIMIEIRKERYK
jgi:hypothetical protein